MIHNCRIRLPHLLLDISLFVSDGATSSGCRRQTDNIWSDAAPDRHSSTFRLPPNAPSWRTGSLILFSISHYTCYFCVAWPALSSAPLSAFCRCDCHRNLHAHTCRDTFREFLLFGCITGYQLLFLISCNRSTKKDLQGIRYFSRWRSRTGWGFAGRLFVVFDGC